MEKEFTAKTVEEAKAKAALEFGASVDEIDFDILAQPKRGLFGFRGEAKVRAYYEVPEKIEEPEENFEKEEIDNASEELPEPADEEPIEQPQSSDNLLEDESSFDSNAVIPSDFDIENSLKIKTARQFLTDILHALNLKDFTIEARRCDNSIVLNIRGDKLGAVIGRRGENLDALQYLTILASNRAEESFCRIAIDCNGYRDKRKETLENLAKRTSAKVIKQGRKIALEPMNPYERRIIHGCVAAIEGVSSHSTGVEPYRKVVIYADHPKYDNSRKNNTRHNDGNSRGDRSNVRKSRDYKQSSGFSTSFEREYKRKSYKPDKNSDAGEFSKETVDTEKNATLYGKIEL